MVQKKENSRRRNVFWQRFYSRSHFKQKLDVTGRDTSAEDPWAQSTGKKTFLARAAWSVFYSRNLSTALRCACSLSTLFINSWDSGVTEGSLHIPGFSCLLKSVSRLAAHTAIENKQSESWGRFCWSWPTWQRLWLRSGSTKALDSLTSIHNPGYLPGDQRVAAPQLLDMNCCKAACIPGLVT